MRIAAILLAAGLSSRYRAGGGRAASKLVELYRGEPLVRHAADAALKSRAAPLLVVTGHAREAVEAALAGLPIRFVHNPDFATGLASSLRAGIAALGAETEGVVILLGDMPLVTGALIDTLIAAAEADPTADTVVPLVGGRRGNPVLLRASMFAPATRLGGDEGARRLLLQPDVRVVEVAMAGPAAALDLDEAPAFDRDAASRL